MEKIRLVSYRRKDRILGETETAAQRRAQMRENGGIPRYQLMESPHYGNAILRLPNQAETTPKVEDASCAITSIMGLKDVSEQLRLSRKAILCFVREGKLRHQRLAKRYVFMAEDVRAFQSQRLAAQIITME